MYYRCRSAIGNFLLYMHGKNFVILGKTHMTLEILIFKIDSNLVSSYQEAEAAEYMGKEANIVRKSHVEQHDQHHNSLRHFFLKE